MSVDLQRPQTPPVDASGSPPRGAQSAPPKPKPMNAALLFGVVVLSISVVGLLYLIQTAQVAGLGYEVTRLERERAAAALENQQLTFELAQLEALPRIEEMAIGSLGMQPVSDYRFMVVPLPPRDDLPLPPPVEQPERSIVLRIWERLTGQSTATNTGGAP